jgi:hypothetical protein
MTSSDPDDHYPDNPSDFGDFDSPERCVECREWAPCSTALSALPDEAGRIEVLRVLTEDCRCAQTTAYPDGNCPLHVGCDDFCGARREPGDDAAELQRALRHEREHQLWGGCSHGG